MILNLLLLYFSTLASDPTGLKIGDQAPDFKAVDQDGGSFTLYEMLEEGPVIVSFYRGSWCKYCMAQMKNYQDSISYLQSKNIQLVAVSPEHEDGIKKTVSISKATFKVVHDEKLKIALNYQVISEKKRSEYMTELDATAVDNQHKYLPVPATYLVGSDKTIKYVYFDPDYKVRPSVSEITAGL